MGGDQELDVGEVRLQPVADPLLPGDVEVGVHLVDQHDAGGRHQRPSALGHQVDARARPLGRQGPEDVEDQGHRRAVAVAHLVEGELLPVPGDPESVGVDLAHLVPVREQPVLEQRQYDGQQFTRRLVAGEAAVVHVDQPEHALTEAHLLVEQAGDRRQPESRAPPHLPTESSVGAHRDQAAQIGVLQHVAVDLVGEQTVPAGDPGAAQEPTGSGRGLPLAPARPHPGAGDLCGRRSRQKGRGFVVGKRVLAVVTVPEPEQLLRILRAQGDPDERVLRHRPRGQVVRVVQSEPDHHRSQQAGLAGGVATGENGPAGVGAVGADQVEVHAAAAGEALDAGDLKPGDVHGVAPPSAADGFDSIQRSAPAAGAAPRAGRPPAGGTRGCGRSRGGG